MVLVAVRFVAVLVMDVFMVAAVEMMLLLLLLLMLRMIDVCRRRTLDE